MLLEPVFVGLDSERPHEPQATFAIGEDAHDMSAPPDLLVQSLQHIGGFEVLMVLARQAVKEPAPEGGGQCLVDVVFDPAGELWGICLTIWRAKPPDRDAPR